MKEGRICGKILWLMDENPFETNRKSERNGEKFTYDVEPIEYEGNNSK